MPSGPRWVSAAELAEYAYCPRAWYYHQQTPEAPDTSATRAGTRYHERVLGRELRREQHAVAYWAALALGALLVVVGLLGTLRP